MGTDVKYFCPGSCVNIEQEKGRDTGSSHFGPPQEFDFDNSSDVRTETGCKAFGGGNCVEVRGQSLLPTCYSWTCEEVGDWIESIGFPLYRDCFVTNFITGRRLINIDASVLTKIGINDFIHIRTITKNIRNILDVKEIPWNRSISLPAREEFGMFLECKAKTGAETEKLTWQKFHDDWHQLKFQPPLCNQALLLPRST